MRVTDKYQSDFYARQLSSLKEKLDRAAVMVSSGKKMTAPSDAPIDYAKSVHVTAQIDRNSQYRRNLNALTSLGATYETSVNTIGDLLNRAKELAVQMGSDTVDAAGRAGAADEIDGIIRQLAVVGNTRIGNTYVFGGKSTATPYALDEDTNTVTFNGSSEVIKVYGDSRTLLDAGISGSRMFGETLIFDRLGELSAHLKANDAEGIRADLTGLDECIDLTANNLTYVGTYTKQVEAILNANESRDLTLTTELSDLADADTVQAYSDYTALATTYQAALLTLSRAQNLSLLNYLR